MKVEDPVIQKMRGLARAAAERAYCPYSKFPVGAAVLADNGEISSGCNVENASFGLSICAERNAVFALVAKGCQKIVAAVIVTPTGNPTPPCGACRQVINEFGSEAEIFSFDRDGRVLHFPLDELLPEAFGPDSLV